MRQIQGHNLSGGTLTVTTANLGSNGTFTQTGGELSFAYFSQTGGAAQFNTGLTLGSIAYSYTLSGGLFSASTLAVQPGGLFTQSGGTLTFDTLLQTGGTVNLQTGINLTSSTLTLSGGSLTVPSITTSGAGSSNFNWSGGGSLTITAQTIDVTNTSDPNFDGFILGSSVTLGNNMSLDQGSTGADPWEYIFGSGSSLTQQTGSSNTTTQLILGATGTGAAPVQYNMEGGTLSVSGLANIGHNGVYAGPATATFTQTSGTVSFGSLDVGQTGPATVALSGGTMTVSGAATLYSGGIIALSAGGSLSVGSFASSSVASNLHWTAGSLTLTNQYFDVSTTTDPTFGGFVDGSALTLNSGMSLTDSARGELLFGSGSTITQNTGSSNTVSEIDMGSSGTGATPVAYNLTGGSMTASFAYVGDNIYTGPNAATFTQSGGTSSFGILEIGNSGTGDACTLSTGTMTVTSAINLESGTFHQSGGTLSFPSFYESGGAANFDKGLDLTSSTVTLAGGSLTTASLKGPGSNLQWTNGSLTLSNQAFDVTTAASDPNVGGYIYGSSLTLGSGMSLILPAAGSIPYEFVFGSGSSITQNTGSSNTMYELLMGSSGTAAPLPVQYNMNGGTLTTTYVVIGDNQEYTGPGAATFTQTSGTASIGALYIGDFGGASSYSLSSGSLIVGSSISNNTGSAIHQTGGSLTSPQTANGGTITQTAGTAALGTLTGTGTVSLGGGSNAASMSVTSFTQSSISIAGNGLLTVRPNSNSANSVSTLSITGSGQLDLTNNHMFIDYGSGPDPIASIAAMIISGYKGGTWRGAGIISSDANMSYGLGYADHADPGNPAGLSSGQIEIMYTLFGDANLDGKVNGTDFTILASNFNQSVIDGWDEGDFNYDGSVNGSDFTLLAANFNQFANQSAASAADLAALDSFASANGISLANVPEPTSVAMIALAGFAGLRRRRNSP